MERVSRNKPPAGLVVISPEACKGCGLCVNACPVKVLRLSEGFNAHGYHPAAYNGSGCTGCGICFYACPEPGAITVYTRAKERALARPSSASTSHESRATGHDPAEAR